MQALTFSELQNPHPFSYLDDTIGVHSLWASMFSADKNTTVRQHPFPNHLTLTFKATAFYDRFVTSPSQKWGA